MKKIGIAAIIMMAFFISVSVYAAGTETQHSMNQGRAMSDSGGISHMLQASKIIDKDVVNSQGEELGEVKDLIFSQNGEISHLVISRDGVLGLGGELVPIPWSMAQANFQDDKLVLNLDRAKLDNAPSFKSDQWDEFFSSDYQNEVRAYYGEGGPAHMNQEKTRMEQMEQERNVPKPRTPGTEMDIQKEDTNPKTQGN